jgi:hypothetical protein
LVGFGLAEAEGFGEDVDEADGEGVELAFFDGFGLGEGQRSRPSSFEVTGLSAQTTPCTIPVW